MQMNNLPELDTQQHLDAFFRDTATYWQTIYANKEQQPLLYTVRQNATIKWVDELAYGKDLRVLEIGCGAGLLSVALAARGCTVHATDPIEEMLELVKQNAEATGVTERITTGIGTIYALDAVDASFDMVIAIGVFPLIDKPEEALQEMVRVTRPGGYVIFSNLNWAGLVSWLDPVRNPLLHPLLLRSKSFLQHHRVGVPGVASRRGSTWPELIARSPRAVDSLLVGAGLRKLKGVTLGFFPFTLLDHDVLSGPFGFRLARRLQFLADRRVPGIRAMGENYLVVAKKERIDAA
jgi:2-polyprenyl-3-methyl-5-hydroxy-6-metoxy-1,4-benzoquinol methylase